MSDYTPARTMPSAPADYGWYWEQSLRAGGQRDGISLTFHEIPKSLLRQTSGPCVECKFDTENTDDGDWICEGCLEDARRQQRSDDRHNDPRRGQAKWINNQR